MKANVYVLIGPPGSGKGTQAANLVEATGAKHLSTGDLLRAAIATASELGVQVQPIVEAGQLVPNKLLLPILEEAFIAVPDEQPVLFDGFPRSREQATLLDEMLARHGREISDAFLLDVSREELFERLSRRGRADDTPEVIEERLDVYERETAPLREYYDARDLLCTVDGEGTPEEVTERLLAFVEEDSDG